MKNVTRRSSEIFAAALALVVGFGSAQTSPATSAISCEWRFGSAMNPALPEVSAAGAGVARAAIAPGEFAAGWMAGNSVLGAAQGVWDLGRNGTIALSNPSGLAGDSSQARSITLRVAQYQDGAIYEQLASVSFPGATLAASNAAFAASADLGSWVVQITQWNIPAGAAANSILITSSYYGSLIDSVVIENSSVVQPPQLAIRRVGPANSQVELSWPASYGNMVLESTTNVNDAQSWTAVSEPVQVNGAVRSVTMDASDATRLYRLKQP